MSLVQLCPSGVCFDQLQVRSLSWKAHASDTAAMAWCAVQSMYVGGNKDNSFPYLSNKILLTLCTIAACAYHRDSHRALAVNALSTMQLSECCV